MAKMCIFYNRQVKKRFPFQVSFESQTFGLCFNLNAVFLDLFFFLPVYLIIESSPLFSI